MDQDERSSQSLDQSGMMMIVAEECLNSNKKRKLQAEETDLLPSPKHFCLEQRASHPDSSCPSSVIEIAECSYTVEEAKSGNKTSSSAIGAEDSSYSTGSSSCASTISSSLDQYCCKVYDKTQEYVEDFICPELAVEDLQEVLNPPAGSYILSSARWDVNNNQDSEEPTTKPTIDQEFEQYFSALMM